MEETKGPEVPVLKKEEEKDEKKGGLSWWSSLTKGAPGQLAAGGTAGGAGAGGGGLTGLLAGLLATKAGLAALALGAAAAVAGIGLIGGRLMNPTGGVPGQSVSLFDNRAATAGRDPGAGTTARDGRRPDSLGYVSGDQSSEEQPPESASAEAGTPPAGAPAGDAAKASDGAKAPEAAQPTAPGESPPAGLGSRAAANFSNKIGVLSSGSGGSQSSAGMARSGPGAAPEAAALRAASAKGGSLAGAPAGAAGKASGRSQVAARRKTGALRQLGQVRREQAFAQSSARAGRTYDGAGTPQGGSIGPEGGVGQGGAGQGGVGAAAGAGPTGGMSQPTPETPGTINPPPDPGGGHNVTPWQKAIDSAMLYCGISLVIIFLVGQVLPVTAPEPYGSIIKGILTALVVIAIGLALAALYLGIRIAFGQFGQILQGTIAIVAGGCLAALGVTLIPNIWANQKDQKAVEATKSWNALMQVSGVVLLAALAWGYLGDKKEIKATDSDYEDAQDTDCSGLECHGSLMPSEPKLDRFLG